jgi:hypothetical protein
LNFKEFFDRYIRGWLPAEAKMQKHSPIKPIAAILFVFISFSLIVFLLISFMIAAPSIGGLIEWDKTYGKEHIIEWGGPIVESSDEGYVMAGGISSSWEDDGDLFLAKIDENGNMDWNKTYQGTFGVGNSLVATSDGGYAIAGSTKSSGSDYTDFSLIKTDSFGNIEWSQTYGKNNSDSAHSLVATSDGGYAIAGFTYPISGWVEPNIIEFLLVKTDAYGNMEWNQTYGEVKIGLSDCLLITTSDGGYALAGIRDHSDDNLDLVVWLTKTDEKGNVQWNQTYGEKGRDYIASSIISTSDGGYAVVGCTITYSLDENDFFLVKTDAYGNMEWKQKYGTSNERGSCIVSATDGGYLLAGLTIPADSEANDLFLVKTDEYGNMEWNQTYGGPGIDHPYFMIKTSDNKYVISGATSISRDMDFDIWLIKIDEHGKALQPESEP